MIFHTKVTTKVPGGPSGEYDDFGNEIVSPPKTVAFRGELRPLSGAETDNGARDMVITRFRLFYPRRIAFTATSTVLVSGLEYKVVGEPEPHSIGGRLHHHEVLLERVTG
ncbi:hypothetical protein [Dermacoccus sp. Tok2021]|uniref:hypothetical protein n=1 Tax=Dermacoccus sp. Tok2021 TaxID=2826873 RepID=UPI001CA70A67|nr:hypothetical protein [Dermacoccus sp. Tok2021]MBZ4498034.1 hypothetical protein [Dermacoccus sp. Tok2021]